MDAQYFERLEQLLNRKLADEEKERLHRIKNTLNISENDALWDIIIAMEYQRTFYETLPQQIEKTTVGILERLSIAAKKEVSIAQAHVSRSLAESVIKQAKKLSTKEHIQTWLLWGAVVLILTLIYGSIMLWAGYGLGSGQMQTLHFILRMPVGILLAGISLCGGLYVGIYAARVLSALARYEL